MKALATVGMLWAWVQVCADVVPDAAPFSQADLNLPPSTFEPFPECADGEINTDTGLSDCPTKTTVRGFDVRISSYLPRASVPLVLEWVALANAILLELEDSWRIRSHFVGGLRHAGVSFYLSPSYEGSANDPYARCRRGCYRHGTRIVEDTLPLSSPAKFDWKSMRRFLVHQLAHAYHAIILTHGHGNKCVLDAYRLSVERDGLHEGTDAAANAKEYFAQVVSYAMRATDGAYCEPNPDRCVDGLIVRRPYRANPGLPVQNKWLLAEYDFNGAALFDAFLDPEGHLDAYQPWHEQDPLLNPPAPERSRNCNSAIWWPE